MSIYDRLNEQQKKGVFTTEGPVLLLAGAGSGKTGVITHRIAHLIDDCDVNSYNILAITFTNKAAREMRERVDDLVGCGADAAWIMTFHAACVRILRRFIDRLGYGINFTIYDTDDQKSLMKEVCKSMDVDTKVYKEKMLLSRISAAKDELVTPDEMYTRANNDYTQMRIAEVYRVYEERLKKNNAVDFDDIINLTVELFEKNDDVLDYYQERFKYIMVDEYQDTNTAQFKLVSLLARKYHNLCVVGDDDQSIYKFRGANIRNILNFKEYFPEAEIIKLEQNYRSKSNILDAANAVIKNNSGRMDKSLWTEQDEGDKIAFNVYETGYAEAEGIAFGIEKNINDGYAYNDCAILYRTNAQSRAIEEKLLGHNIPYRIYGGINFYSRKEIKDILAYLKTIDNGMDEIAVRRILNVPKRGIGATSVGKIQAYADEQNIGFYEALKQAEDIPGLGRSASKITPFTDLIRLFRAELHELSIVRLINDIIEKTGYMDYLAENDSPEEVEERRANIDELISKAATYEDGEETPTLSGFLEEVALVADIDNMDDNNNVVSLMTLHSAKGLEFPIVYLAGMEDGLFPSYMCIDSDDPSELEEERRLCYVGITRAKQKLIMSAAKVRMVRGETHMNKVSRFISEIPAELMVNSTQGPAHKILTSDGTDKDHFHLPPRKAGESRFQSFQHDVLKEDIFDKKPSAGNAGLGYGIGDKVRHIKFGTGTVKEIKNGGRDYEVTVDFENGGTKKMFASFAKLQKI
ncbi:aTP-dependent DNA helicase PcrA [Butyrivibrio sp. CAG:318]|jgi:ATP-dependent DNA helicase pcrA|nr:aTP-dependent DNA helicase PcrA [Butyrivibrio sp. CAG:318]